MSVRTNEAYLSVRVIAAKRVHEGTEVLVAEAVHRRFDRRPTLGRDEGIYVDVFARFDSLFEMALDC